MHPGKDYVYASREEGQAERGPECPNLRVLSCWLINHTREYDLLAEYMRRFHENINRVWVKTSEYGGKITQIFKRVYSFNRDLRVLEFLRMMTPAEQHFVIEKPNAKMFQL